MTMNGPKPRAEQEWREDFETALDRYQPGSDAEKKLVRKIDRRIVSPPCLNVFSP